MSYTLRKFKQSPNYTTGQATLSIYGRKRSISFGAGHWWDDPTRKPSFDGVVNTFMNPSRQASAHAVVGDRVVQEMVRSGDTAWATNNANPYTYAIETDPQIIYMWRSGGDKAKAKRIFETLCEYIADKGYHNLKWYAHNHWWQTACNPIDWNAVMKRAKQIYADKHTSKPASKPVPAAVKLKEGKLKFRALLNPTNVWDLTTNPNYKAATQLKKGDIFEAVAYIDFNNARYYITEYSVKNGKKVGVNSKDVELVVTSPNVPEWQKNLKTIAPVNLMVLVAQTPIVDLVTLKTIKQLGQGTNVDFTKSTTVKGVEYLISSYSATNAIPNGIKRADVGVPAKPPVNEKPEWLKNWADIVDVTMYARADTDLVDLENGKTIKVIPRTTAIEVASTTEWHGQKYAITKYSTDKKLGQGIRIDDLDAKPVADNGNVTPAPEQPPIKTVDERLSWLEKAVNAILSLLKIKV